MEKRGSKKAEGGSMGAGSKSLEGWEGSGKSEGTASGGTASGGGSVGSGPKAAPEEVAFKLELGKGRGRARLSWAHALESGLVRGELEAGKTTATLDLEDVGELPEGRVHRSIVHDLFRLSAEPMGAEEELISLTQPDTIGPAINLAFLLDLPKVLNILSSNIDNWNVEAVADLISNGENIPWLLDTISKAITNEIHTRENMACGFFRDVVAKKDPKWELIMDAVRIRYQEERVREAREQKADPFENLLLEWTVLLPPFRCPVCYVSLLGMCQALLDNSQTELVQTEAFTLAFLVDWPILHKVETDGGRGTVKMRMWLERAFYEIFCKRIEELEKLGSRDDVCGKGINQLFYMGRVGPLMSRKNVEERNEMIMRVAKLLRPLSKTGGKAAEALAELNSSVEKHCMDDILLLQNLSLL